MKCWTVKEIPCLCSDPKLAIDGLESALTSIVVSGLGPFKTGDNS